MQASGWSNGSGYFGIRISHSDRDQYFDRSWPSVVLDTNEGSLEASLSGSFWRNCSELRGRQVTQWLKGKNLAPWPRGNPPQFELHPLGERRFRLSHSRDRSTNYSAKRALQALPGGRGYGQSG